MFYYIDTIEQVKGQEEGTINEYGARTKEIGTFEEVQAKYFTKLANVSNDIGEGKNHYYMDIRIVNSEGGIEAKQQLGQYVES